jgi:hypothetical protein
MLDLLTLVCLTLGQVVFYGYHLVVFHHWGWRTDGLPFSKLEVMV